MAWTQSDILDALDNCCDSFTFPMLDNGHVYLAATRLSAFRSPEDWHIAIEVFGFSPRAGIPDVNVYHFGSNILRKKRPEDFVTSEAFDNYVTNNPFNESDFFYPIEEGDWLDEELGETVRPGTSIMIRDKKISVPTRDEYRTLGIPLEDSTDVFVYELCRAIAATHRDLVLANEGELRSLVPKDTELILRLDEWNHPDIVDPVRKASNSETFQQIASVLESGDASKYRPSLEPNTHWSNWPEGGQL